MRIRGFALALTVGLVVASAAVPAGAGQQLPAPVIDPASGPPGTVIVVTGTGCGLLPGDTTILLNLVDSLDDAVATNETESGLLGVWVGELTVPAEALPGQTYNIRAFCGPEGSQYPDVPFLVTGVPPPTPPPPTPVPIPITAVPLFTG